MNEEHPVEAASPSIYIKMLKEGNVLLLEGDTDIYELTLRYPEHGIVDVTSTNPALRATTIGQFMYSVRGFDHTMKLNAIQKGWSLVLRFSNGAMQTQAIISARVSGIHADGTRWNFDVF